MADPDLVQFIGQIREAPHRLVVHRRDDIAQCVGTPVDAAQAGARGRGVRKRIQDRYAFDTETRRRLFAYGDDADPGCWHMAVTDELRYHAVDDVDRNGESATGARSGGRDDGGVYANHPPAGIKQGATAIARLSQCICLEYAGTLMPRTDRRE